MVIFWMIFWKLLKFYVFLNLSQQKQTFEAKHFKSAFTYIDRGWIFYGLDQYLFREIPPKIPKNLAPVHSF